MRKRMIGLAAITALQSSAAQAQPNAFPPFYVYSEEDNEATRRCGVTYEPAVAAVQTVLRSNGIRMSQDLGGTIHAYINLNVVPLTSGGQPTGECIMNISLEFLTLDAVLNPVENRMMSAKIVYCDQAGVALGRPHVLRDEYLSTLRTMTEQCVSRYERVRGQ